MSFTGCAKITSTISLGLLTGALATTSFITVPAVVAIAPKADANQSLLLIRKRIDILTALCGTVSVSTLTLAFLFGSKHGYLVYAGAASAILLRHQQDSLREIGDWLREEYYLTKEVVATYVSKKLGRRPPRSSRGHSSSKKSAKPVTQVPPEQVAGALEKLGASSLTNCLVSGIAFAIAAVGVLGDMD